MPPTSCDCALTTRRVETRLAALRRNFGDVSVSGVTGGLHILWRLPPGVPDAAIVEKVALRARVGVYSLASGGACAARMSTLTRRGIILGYGSLLRKQIDQGIARLSDAIDDAVDDPNADISAFFCNSGGALSGAVKAHYQASPSGLSFSSPTGSIEPTSSQYKLVAELGTRSGNSDGGGE